MLLSPKTLDTHGDHTIFTVDMTTVLQGRRRSILNHFICCTSAFDSACDWLRPRLLEQGKDVGDALLNDEQLQRYAMISEQADRFRLWGHDFNITSTREDSLYAQLDAEVPLLLDRLEQELDIKKNWRGIFNKQELAGHPLSDSWQYLATNGQDYQDIPLDSEAIEKTVNELYHVSNRSQTQHQSQEIPVISSGQVGPKHRDPLERKIPDESLHTLALGVSQAMLQTKHEQHDFATSSPVGLSLKSPQRSNVTTLISSEPQCNTEYQDPCYLETVTHHHRQYQQWSVDNRTYFGPADEVLRWLCALNVT
jgi:hypothetical protein